MDYIFKVNVEFLKLDDKSKAIDSKEAFKSLKTIYLRYEVELNDLIVSETND